MANVSVHRDFKLASYVILIAVGAGIVKLFSVYSQENLSELNTALGMGLNVLILVLFVWLSLNIARGKNWARITFAVIAASILVFTPLFLINEFTVSILVGSLTSVFIVCLLVALLLLYSKGARAWYAERR